MNLHGFLFLPSLTSHCRPRTRAHRFLTFLFNTSHFLLLFTRSLDGPRARLVPERTRVCISCIFGFLAFITSVTLLSNHLPDDWLLLNFLHRLFGKDWKKVAALVRTRTVVQVPFSPIFFLFHSLCSFLFFFPFRPELTLKNTSRRCRSSPKPSPLELVVHLSLLLSPLSNLVNPFYPPFFADFVGTGGAKRRSSTIETDTETTTQRLPLETRTHILCIP